MGRAVLCMRADTVDVGVRQRSRLAVQAGAHIVGYSECNFGQVLASRYQWLCQLVSLCCVVETRPSGEVWQTIVWVRKLLLLMRV